MSTATPISEERIRQIAILVSSVDPSAARQLLMQLPTEAAKQVRAYASRLSSIPMSEKQQVIAAFRQSAVSKSQTTNAAAVSAGGPVRKVPLNERVPVPGPNATISSAADAVFAKSIATSSVDDALGHHMVSAEPFDPTLDQASSDAEWTKLSSDALIRFLRNERTLVIAVVLSQIAPRKAAEILQRLPATLSREVLHRLGNLQSIDPDAMAAIDEHLSESLSEYQHTIEGEQQNEKRIKAILSAAPQGLRREWREVIARGAGGDEIDTQSLVRTEVSVELPGATQSTKIAEQSPIANSFHEPNAAVRTTSGLADAAPSVASQVAHRIEDIYGDAVITTATLPQSNSPASHSSQPQNQAENFDGPQILSFEEGKRRLTSTAISDAERERMRSEMLKLLDLPQRVLADLLNNLPTPTLLLSLAGASPQFMKRFSRMLEPKDHAALQQRLQQIGPLNLRDIDEAQQRLIQAALPYRTVASQTKAA